MLIEMSEDTRQQRLSLPPGTLRWETMNLLWGSRECTVWEVVDKLNQKLNLNLHYTTVASTLTKLCSMGLVVRSREPGTNIFRYSPLVLPQELEKGMTKGAVKTLLTTSDDPEEALSFLVDLIGQADGKLLAELKNAIDTALTDRDLPASRLRGIPPRRKSEQ
jgi:predicted transcriptional regulator